MTAAGRGGNEPEMGVGAVLKPRQLRHRLQRPRIDGRLQKSGFHHGQVWRSQAVHFFAVFFTTSKYTIRYLGTVRGTTPTIGRCFDMVRTPLQYQQ